MTAPPPGRTTTVQCSQSADGDGVWMLQVVSSSIVDKYIGESARLIREMFNYARDHQPCIIFMDEIDAIGEWFKRSWNLLQHCQQDEVTAAQWS